MSGDGDSALVDVGALLEEPDALSREAGERVAREIVANLPGRTILNFSNVRAMNSAFMGGFLFALLEHVKLDDLRKVIEFKGLSSRGAEVVRNSLKAVRVGLSGGDVGKE